MLHVRFARGVAIPRVIVRGDTIPIQVLLTNDTGKAAEARLLDRNCEDFALEVHKGKMAMKVVVEAVEVSAKGDVIKPNSIRIETEPKELYVDARGKCSFGLTVKAGVHGKFNLRVSIENQKRTLRGKLEISSVLTSELVLVGNDQEKRREITRFNNIEEETRNFRVIDLLGDVRNRVIVEEKTDTIMAGFGTIIWTPALILSEYLLLQRSRLKGKTVLELGAGTGVCSLAAALCSPNKVIATDVSPALELLQSNLLMNSPRFNSNRTELNALAFDWGNEDHLKTILQNYGRPDFIIASEIFYSEQVIPLLRKTLVSLCMYSEQDSASQEAKRRSKVRTTVFLAQSPRATLVDVDLLLGYLSQFFQVIKVIDEQEIPTSTIGLFRGDPVSKGIGKPRLYELSLKLLVND